MNIELIKAILHVLDPAVDAPILSEAILPPSEDALQYLAGHAAKCFASDEAKACTLADDSAFLPLLWNIEDDFEKKTAVIAGDWFRVMQENPAIPAGDAAFLLLMAYMLKISIDYLMRVARYGTVSVGLKIPMWIVYSILPLFTTLTMVRLGEKYVRKLINRKKGEGEK